MKKHPFCRDVPDANLPDEQHVPAPERNKSLQVYALTVFGFLLLLGNVFSMAASNNLFSKRPASMATSASPPQEEGYYFPPADTADQNMTWAYSHYNPELGTQPGSRSLNGNIAQDSRGPGVAADTIGAWSDNSALPCTIIIMQLGDSYLMTSSYLDGSVETKPLIVRAEDGEERLYEGAEYRYGDYVVIRSNGNLAFYGKAGLMYELPPR
jgi:hypothetical protein